MLFLHYFVVGTRHVTMPPLFGMRHTPSKNKFARVSTVLKDGLILIESGKIFIANKMLALHDYGLMKNYLWGMDFENTFIMFFFVSLLCFFFLLIICSSIYL